MLADDLLAVGVDAKTDFRGNVVDVLDVSLDVALLSGRSASGCGSSGYNRASPGTHEIPLRFGIHQVEIFISDRMSRLLARFEGRLVSKTQRNTMINAANTHQLVLGTRQMIGRQPALLHRIFTASCLCFLS